MISLFLLILLDLIFLAVLAAIVIPICMGMRATFAVLKRNFVGYFSNPTGYIFLCLFVLLTSIAAFWPHEFFNSNLANLDQLNRWLPAIMLVFIPAITMSIWAEERRQGTDELLLTLPAGDFDIVVGKYLAAGSIFTASLLFSQLCNFTVLGFLSLWQLDTGLFFSTYLGYWMVGMSMLAIGMVASFLTSNLTVGFILGALFNAPLVFAVNADLIMDNPVIASLVSGWSMGAQFDDFGRGVISLSSTTYFFMVSVVGLYLSMVLIGARHWSGGRDGTPLLGHYLARTLSLVVIVLGVNFVFSNNSLLSNRRQDMTLGGVASLSPDTKRLIRELDAEHPVQVEAYISAQVPEVYAKTKSDLISMLKELRATRGKSIQITIHTLDQAREESIEIATLAEERYGITPQPVRTRTRGTIKDEEIFLAAAFTCGLDKVVVPFFDYGVPVEYELIRSIATVAQKERKKLGIVRTEARLMGGFTFAGGQPRNIPKQAIVEELEKQYDVEEIDPSMPIDVDDYDAMVVVQPSSMAPEEFGNLLTAIKQGMPTAVFEDPRPVFMTMAPATGEPKMGPGGMGGMNPMMGGGGGPEEKADIRQLWNVLGLDPPGQSEESFGPGPLFSPDLVWQRYNPYPKLQIQGIPDSWVFCRKEAPGGDESISDKSPITSGLEEIFFPVPGVLEEAKNSELSFDPLVQTGKTAAGTVSFRDFMESERDPNMLRDKQGEPAKKAQVIAAHIHGPLPEDDTMSDAEEDEPAAEEPADEATDDAAAATDTEAPPAPEEKPKREINVVYVADIDLMMSAFLRIRARPGEDEEISWNFENVTFLLNTIDFLADDDSYIEIRKRKPHHSTLRRVEYQAQKAIDDELQEQLKSQKEYNDSVAKIEEENKKEIEKFEERVKELQTQQLKEGQQGIRMVDLQKALQDLAVQQERLKRRQEVQEEQLRRKLENNLDRIRRRTDLDILKTKNDFKLLAVVLPPIPPLLVGLIVFVRRRLREREGIAKTRRR